MNHWTGFSNVSMTPAVVAMAVVMLATVGTAPRLAIAAADRCVRSRSTSRSRAPSMLLF